MAKAIDPLRDEVSSKLAGLPVQRIHGDCHRGNILTDRGRVSCVVDLDHLPSGPRVYDLAYSLSSGLSWLLTRSGEPDHEQARITDSFLAGYQSETALSSEEVAAQEPMMIAIQLVMAEWNLR